jgi:hypothetical protein
LFALSLTGDARIASTASFVPADVAVSPELNVPDIADPGAFVLPQSAPLPPRAPRHAFASRLRSGVVRSRSGASARVAPRYAAQFQCLVDWLDQEGFKISSMGGVARRPYGGSLHPIGGALDIDQVARNRLRHGKRFPAGVNAAAAQCGLMHGDRTVWHSHPDYGHFQVAGLSRGYRHVRRVYAQYGQPAGNRMVRMSRTTRGHRLASVASGSPLDVR